VKILCTVIILSLLTATAVFANGYTCSSADQQLSFGHHTSNGGAPLDVSTFSYKGQSFSIANTMSGSGSPRPYTLKVQDKIQIGAVEKGGGTTKTTSIARASGSVTVDGKTIEFSEWVICVDVMGPVCHRCP